VFEVGGRFFLVYANVQGAFAFLLSAFIGPGLISPDLANGGLPLYFYRPFSRLEYVVGKMTVLFVLLSQITWIPGLFLWCLQAGISQPKWWRSNVWLAESIVLTSLLWIFLIVFFALALSAWVKWRIVAGALLLVTFFLTSGLGAAINAILRTTKGSLVDPGANLERVTMWLMRREPPDGLSLEESLISLAVMLLLCLWMLTRKLKANEVVR
jgi:ABC-2 type transport system permease protein